MRILVVIAFALSAFACGPSAEEEAEIEAEAEAAAEELQEELEDLVDPDNDPLGEGDPLAEDPLAEDPAEEAPAGPPGEPIEREAGAETE